MGLAIAVNCGASIGTRQRRATDEPYRTAFCVDRCIFMVEPPLDIHAKSGMIEAACASVGKAIDYTDGSEKQSAIREDAIGISEKEIDVFVKQPLCLCSFSFVILGRGYWLAAESQIFASSVERESVGLDSVGLVSYGITFQLATVNQCDCIYHNK